MKENKNLLDLLSPLLSEWGISPLTIKLVSQSENTVFKVTSHDQQEYALRIHRPGYNSLTELKSEQIWSQSLSEARIKIPAAYKTNAGDYYLQLEWNDSLCLVGLMQWINATSLQSILEKRTEPSFLVEKVAAIGRICAQLHNQATTWQPPDDFDRHHLNVEGFLGEQPFWGRFWEAPLLSSEEQELFIMTREKLKRILLAHGEHKNTFSMIHADLHAGNFLVVDGDLLVIDFDDAGFGWHIYDLAVALSVYRERENFESIKHSMIKAYRQVRDISNDELSLLPYFFLIRTLASIGWASDRPEVTSPESIQSLIKFACHDIESLGWH